ncbi:MAG: hypothetical protein AAGB31_08630, partial [Bdellovibrio sp.]
MKVRFNRTAWRALGGMTATGLLLVSFQNCGKAGFDSDLADSLDAGSSSVDLIAKYGSTTAAKVEDVPFAFDAAFDTITYNSCSDSHLRNNSAFFSLKAGAYSSGGIQLNSDFYNYADQTFKPVYPETSLTENQYKEYLADSPANRGAVPTMAMRVKNSLSDVYTTNSAVTLWTDVVPMVGVLTDSLVMDAYGSKGSKATYFPFSSEQKVMESSLNFNTGEELSEEFRNIFMSSGVLALTYMSDSSEVHKVRSPSSAYPYKTAYGRGYNLTFGPYPAAGAASTNPNRVLTQLIETDLANPGVGSQAWNCNRVYRVVRAADAATLCPAHTYTEIKGNAT